MVSCRTWHTVVGPDLWTPEPPKDPHPSAQNRNLSSSSNDIRYLHNSVMQINDKLNQILSSSASVSGLLLLLFSCHLLIVFVFVITVRNGCNKNLRNILTNLKNVTNS